jgi:hypothetical protein
MRAYHTKTRRKVTHAAEVVVIVGRKMKSSVAIPEPTIRGDLYKLQTVILLELLTFKRQCLANSDNEIEKNVKHYFIFKEESKFSFGTFKNTKTIVLLKKSFLMQSRIQKWHTDVGRTYNAERPISLYAFSLAGQFRSGASKTSFRLGGAEHRSNS